MIVQRFPYFDLYTNDNGSVMIFNHERISTDKRYGRPIKKRSRRGLNEKGKLRSAGLNKCGHGHNPHKKR